MKKLIIIGAGGVGRETVQLVADINDRNPEWQLLGFVDDAIVLQGKQIQGVPVLGTIEWLNAIDQECWVVCSISLPEIKRQIVARLNNPNLHYARLIHPTAVVSQSVVIGVDVIIPAFFYSARRG